MAKTNRPRHGRINKHHTWRNPGASTSYRRCRIYVWSAFKPWGRAACIIGIITASIHLQSTNTKYQPSNLSNTDGWAHRTCVKCATQLANRRFNGFLRRNGIQCLKYRNARGQPRRWIWWHCPCHIFHYTWMWKISPKVQINTDATRAHDGIIHWDGFARDIRRTDGWVSSAVG